MNLRSARHLRLLAVLISAFLCAALVHAAEPVDPALVLSALRESLRKGPVAERVRVTIRPLGKPSRSDEFIVKVDPGRKADRTDTAVWVELGELRVYAGDGHLVAVHAGDEASCFTTDYKPPLKPGTLRALLPPIPAPLIALMLPDDKDSPVGSLSSGLTPYTPSVTWRTGAATGVAPVELVTLEGVREPFPGEHAEDDDLKVVMTIDAASSRPTRFTAVLPDGAELKLDFEAVAAGDPHTWEIRSDNRVRVKSLTDLRVRRGDAAAAKIVPDLVLLDANWVSWDPRAVFKRIPNLSVEPPTHLALLFVRETATDAFGVPTADSKAGDEELQRLEAEIAGATPPGQTAPVRLVHQIVPVMLRLDDNTRRKVAAAAALQQGAPRAVGQVAVGEVGGNIIWAPSVARTIDRFAPDASSAIVIMRADHSLAGVISLDKRAADHPWIRAELRKALGLEEPTPPPPK